jgi:hypothetical protein
MRERHSKCLLLRNLVGNQSMVSLTLDEARAAKAVVKNHLQRSGLKAVVGIGITRVRNTYAVKVNLSVSPPQGMTSLPKEIEGVPVRFELTGPVRAQESA